MPRGGGRKRWCDACRLIVRAARARARYQECPECNRTYEGRVPNQACCPGCVKRRKTRLKRELVAARSAQGLCIQCATPVEDRRRKTCRECRAQRQGHPRGPEDQPAGTALRSRVLSAWKPMDTRRWRP